MPERAREHVEETQRRWLRALGLPEPAPLPRPDPEQFERYLLTDPDQGDTGLPDRAPVVDRPDIGRLSSSVEILVNNVDALRSVLGDPVLEGVCFGTVPGGGLDAYSERLPDSDQYAVYVPAGLFSLSNLFAKLVVTAVSSSGVTRAVRG